MSPTGRGIGNLLDTLPGTGPRTLLGALALVVGFTFLVQPENQAEPRAGFDDAYTAAPPVAPKPIVDREQAKDDLEAPPTKHESEIEAEADSVLR